MDDKGPSLVYCVCCVLCGWITSCWPLSSSSAADGDDTRGDTLRSWETGARRNGKREKDSYGEDWNEAGQKRNRESETREGNQLDRKRKRRESHPLKFENANAKKKNPRKGLLKNTSR
jgi:hypothetical protein